MKHKGKMLFCFGALVALSGGWAGFPHVLYERQAQPLQFSHRTHSGKAGQKCEDCHAVRPDGTFAGVPGIGQCAGCHAQALGNTPQEKVLVERYVTPNREIPWLEYARQPENVYFSHATHVKLARLTCQQCHRQHGDSDGLRVLERNRISGYSRDIDHMKMEACVECHRERSCRRGCLDCHK